MRQTSEPTVEEILESIKKVIARDNRASAADERRQREKEGVSPTPRTTENLPFQSHGYVMDEHADEEADDVLDLADSAAEMADDAAEDAASEAPASGESPLVTEHAQANMRESLAALAMLSTPPAQPQIVRSGETSLEGLARELLRPALAEWLDRNLPPLVERLVAAEISRIVGKRG